MGFDEAYAKAEPAEKKGGFEPLPDGDYVVWLDSVEFSNKCGKDKNRDGIQYQFTIIEGMAMNRKLWKTQYTDTDAAAPYVKADIEALGMAHLPNWSAVKGALPSRAGSTLALKLWTGRTGYQNIEICELVAAPGEQSEPSDDGEPEPTPPIDDDDLPFD